MQELPTRNTINGLCFFCFNAVIAAVYRSVTMCRMLSATHCHMIIKKDGQIYKMPRNKVNNDWPIALLPQWVLFPMLGQSHFVEGDALLL